MRKMIIHSPTGYRSRERRLPTGIEERQLRRLQHRIAHLAALMKLNAVRGTGTVKFPPDGNLEVGKNENMPTRHTVRIRIREDADPERRGSW